MKVTTKIHILSINNIQVHNRERYTKMIEFTSVEPGLMILTIGNDTFTVRTNELQAAAQNTVPGDKR